MQQLLAARREYAAVGNSHIPCETVSSEDEGAILPRNNVIETAPSKVQLHLVSDPDHTPQDDCRIVTNGHSASHRDVVGFIEDLLDHQSSTLQIH